MWHILDEFRIASYVKELIEYIEELVENYPRREYVLKDRMVSDGYELLELVYLGNVMDDRLDIQKKDIGQDKYVGYLFRDEL